MLPDGLTLRPVAPDDLDDVIALIGRCDRTYADWLPEWTPLGADWERDRWQEHLARPERWSRVAVAPDGEIVGAISWSPAREGRGTGAPVPGLAHVSDVFVDPTRWRRGIAHALLDLAVEAMREAGFTRAQLHTPQGAPAQRLYEAHGWRPDPEPIWDVVLKMRLVRYERPLT